MREKGFLCNKMKDIMSKIVNYENPADKLKKDVISGYYSGPDGVTLYDKKKITKLSDQNYISDKYSKRR